MADLEFGFAENCRTGVEQTGSIAAVGLPSYSAIKGFHMSCIEAKSMATVERTSMAAITTGTMVGRTTVVIVTGLGLVE